MTGPSPEKVMQLVTGGWATSILGAAAQHGIFTALEGNPATTEDVSKKTAISLRGAQALLDGLTGLGLLTLSGGRYQNTSGGVRVSREGEAQLSRGNGRSISAGLRNLAKSAASCENRITERSGYCGRSGQSLLARFSSRHCRALLSCRADGGGAAGHPQGRRCVMA